MNFIIIGMPKTGKTMLCHSLDRIDDFRVFDEVYIDRRKHSSNMPPHPMKIINDIRKRSRENDLYAWYNKKYGANNMEDLKPYLSKEHYNEWFSTIFLKNLNTGFKLHQHHIELLPYILEYLKENNHIKILHTNRKNKIKQAIATIGNRYRGNPFKIDGKDIENVIEDYDKRVNDIYKWFRNGNFDYKEFWYEDITGDVDIKVLNLKPFKNFLGVDMPDYIDVKTRKNTQVKTKDNLLNFDEIKEYFQNTKYGDMI